MTDQPAPPPNVNLELTKNIRHLLAQAERGQIGSVMIVGASANGAMIKMAMTQDQHLYTVFIGLAMMQDAIKFRISQIEHAGQQSPIQRALHMPANGG